MAKYNLHFIITLIITFTVGCKDNPANYEEKLIDLSQENYKELKIDEFFEFREFVFLETLQESFIKNINKLYVKHDKIVILDISNKSILIFDQNGSFFNKINNVGKGPGEFLHASDMIVNNEGDIEILDPRSEKIIRYNIDGEFISESRMNFRARSFVKDKKGNYIFYTSHSRIENSDCLNYPLIVITNKELDIIDCFLEFDSKWEGITMEFRNANTHFYKNDDALIFIPTFPILFTTFRFFDDNFTLNNRFIVPNQKKLENYLANLEFSPGLSRKIIESGFNITMNDYFENNDFIYAELFGEITTQFIVNKTTNETYIRNKESDNYFGFFSAHPVNGDLKNVVFDIVSPLTFMRSDYKIFKNKKNEDHLKEEDNPVLIFYNFSPHPG